MLPIISSKPLFSYLSPISFKKYSHQNCNSQAKIENLKTLLSYEIFDQPTPVEKMSNHFQKVHLGLTDPDRCAGTFLFAGPTGVGKTALAKLIGKITNFAFLRLEMSNFKHPTSGSTLIGSERGYVACDQGGVLTNWLEKSKGKGILLLDEIEKAHPNVHTIFLSLFDEGVMQSGFGKTIKAKDLTVIMTTNLGSRHIEEWTKQTDSQLLDEDTLKELVSPDINRYLPPEIRGRLTDTLYFKPLSEETLQEIAEHHLIKTLAHIENSQKLAKLNFTIEVIDSVVQQALSANLLAYGARKIKDVASDILMQPVIQALLPFNEEQRNGGILNLDVDFEGKIEAQLIPSPPKPKLPPSKKKYSRKLKYPLIIDLTK